MLHGSTRHLNSLETIPSTFDRIREAGGGGGGEETRESGEEGGGGGWEQQ